MLWMTLVKTCNDCVESRDCMRGMMSSRPRLWLTGALVVDFTVIGGRRIAMPHQDTDEYLSHYPAGSCTGFKTGRAHALDC